MGWLVFTMVSPIRQPFHQTTTASTLSNAPLFAITPEIAKFLRWAHACVVCCVVLCCVVLNKCERPPSVACLSSLLPDLTHPSIHPSITRSIDRPMNPRQQGPAALLHGHARLPPALPSAPRGCPRRRLRQARHVAPSAACLFHFILIINPSHPHSCPSTRGETVRFHRLRPEAQPLLDELRDEVCFCGYACIHAHILAGPLLLLNGFLCGWFSCTHIHSCVIRHIQGAEGLPGMDEYWAITIGGTRLSTNSPADRKLP